MEVQNENDYKTSGFLKISIKTFSNETFYVKYAKFSIGLISSFCEKLGFDNLHSWTRHKFFKFKKQHTIKFITNLLNGDKQLYIKKIHIF